MRAECGLGCNPAYGFYTTVHIAQNWHVSTNGDFIDIATNGDCLHVTHGPSPNSAWVCASCGAEAVLHSDR